MQVANKLIVLDPNSNFIQRTLRPLIPSRHSPAINDRVGSKIMPIFRPFVVPLIVFCTVLVLTSYAERSRASEQQSLIGRWQVTDNMSYESSDQFIMDIVSCGEKLCGIWVKKGQCDRMVLKPYEPTTDGKPYIGSSVVVEQQSYVFTREDLQEEYILSGYSIEDDLVLFYAENRRSLEKRKSSWFRIGGDRDYGMTFGFKHLGPAECKVPIS